MTSGPVRTRSLAAGLAALWLGAAVAQTSASYGPARTTVSGGSITVTMVVPSTVTGDGTLDVTYFGDVDWANETVTVSVEGTQVAILPPGAQCGDSTASVTVPATTLATAAADGSLSVTFQASPAVNAICRTSRNRGTVIYSTAFSFSGDLSLAVQGTLAYATAISAPPPPAATSGSASPEATLLANRAALILSHRIETPRRIKRLQSRSAATRGTLSFDGIQLLSVGSGEIAVRRDGLGFALGDDAGGAMVWAEGAVTAFDDGTVDDGRFGILHIGADWRVGHDTLLGIAAQIDSYSHDEIASGNEASGTGWMLGPVLTTALSPGLYVDAHLAWGRAGNQIDAAGGSVSFDSERMLAEMSLTGEVVRGAYTVYPEAELGYYSEDSDPYSAAAVGTSPGSAVSIAQARLGARLERAVESAGARDATAFADLRGVWSETVEGTLAAGSFAREIEGFSMEAEIGLSLLTRGGASLDASIGMGGLLSGTETVTARFGLVLPTR